MSEDYIARHRRLDALDCPREDLAPRTDVGAAGLMHRMVQASAADGEIAAPSTTLTGVAR